MTLQELIDEWDQDSQLKRTEIVSESLNTPRLHAKYFRIYVGEKAKLIQWMNDFKVLKLDKYEFYVDGPSPETPPEWKLPAKGCIIKADVERYMDADEHIIKLSQRVDLQKEKIKMIEAIIASLNFRNNTIKNAIEMIRFESGS